MLPLHYLTDEVHQERLAQAARLQPGRQQAALRRARRAARQAVQAIRKAFQLRA